MKPAPDLSANVPASGPPASEPPASRPYAALSFSLLLHGGVVAGIAALPLLQQPLPQPLPAQVISLVNLAETAQVPQPAQAPQPQPVQAKTEPPLSVPAPETTALVAAPSPIATKAPEAEPALAAAPLPKAKPQPPAPKPLRRPETQPAQQSTPQPSLAEPVQPAASAHPDAPTMPAAADTSHQAALPAAPLPSAPQESGDADASEPPVVREARFRRPPKPPQYPPRSLTLEQQGISVVRALIDIDGASREVRLWRSSGHEALDRAAIAAVRGWAFEAARIGERPVLAWVEIPVRFEIR